MSNTGNNRPKNMSQLDYLWTNYGSYTVSNSVDTENSIPTSQAVKDIIQTIKNGIVKLDTYELDDKIKIIGFDNIGNELTSIEIDKDTKVVDFQIHSITQEDLDNNHGTTLGEKWLVLKTSNNQEFWVFLDDLVVKGQETDTIVTDAKDGKVAATLKINNPIVNKSVDLKTTPYGLYADLIVNPDSKSKVLILKGDNGVEANFTWDTTNIPIGFRFLTFDEYQTLSPEEGIIYFITDDPAIYFQGIRFSSLGLNPEEYATKEDLKWAVQDETDRATAVEEQLNSKVEQILVDLSKKVDWIDIDTNRKAIVLNNNDMLLGTDTTGSTYNLIMLNKWNVIDAGSTSLPFNINTPAGVRPTVQEAGTSGDQAEEIAYLKDFNWTDI